MKSTLGLPTPGGKDGKIMSFFNNLAGGYGKDIATAPRELVLDELGEHAQAYVPGKTSLDFTFSMRDAQGEAVVGSYDLQISHLVCMYVCVYTFREAHYGILKSARDGPVLSSSNI